jgi:hypothetical protein
MAILRDEEEQKGTGLSGALGQPTQDPQDQTMTQPPVGGSGQASIRSPQGTTSPSVTAMPKQQKAGTGTFANLKSYLQAAQGGGRVAQAATQRVQNVGTSAQKGLQQAGQAFERKVDAGSLANLGTAGQEASGIIGAARATTYQAPQPTPEVQTQVATQDATQSPPAVDTAAPAPAPAPAQPQQYFTPEQTQLFADIINAQYQGPASLQQAGLYESAAQKARVAQEAATKSQTAGGRESLLRDIFSRGRDYSRGASKLDALLLNTSQQGVEQLQQQATEAGKSQERLQALQNLSAAQAQGRTREIQQVREGARGEFTKARSDEEAAVETRIDDLIKNPALDESGNPIPKLDTSGNPVLDAAGNPVFQTEWERLPEFFRQSLAEKGKQGQWELSPEEAAILGVSSGEGLYNIRPDDIRTTEAERGRIITKDELSRQLALQQLAGTDVSQQLQKDLLYSDLTQAGTQDLASSLDVDSFRKLLDESQQGFKTAAETANLTGTGRKKVSRGNVFGKKTKTYGASVGGNVADMLREAGYDVGAEGEATRSLLSDRDLLNRYLGATSTSRDVDANIGGSALEGTVAGAGTGASIGAMTGTGPLGAGAGAVVGAGIGGQVGANTLDATQYYSDLAKELEEKLGIKGLGAIGQGTQDVRGAIASPIEGLANIGGSSVVGDVFRGIGGAVSGIDTGAMKAYGSSVAKDLAIKDLQNKYAQFLQGQGFENRANIVDTDATRARSAALQQLLRRQG